MRPRSNQNKDKEIRESMPLHNLFNFRRLIQRLCTPRNCRGFLSQLLRAQQWVDVASWKARLSLLAGIVRIMHEKYVCNISHSELRLLRTQAAAITTK